MSFGAADLIGQRVGHIQVRDTLGEGGMGTVYVGFDETLRRRVALKVVRSEFRLSAESRARFLREARILSQLAHPNVCTVFDLLEHEGHSILVLELVAGESLRARLDRGLPEATRWAVARQLLDVLAAVHDQGVIHRDLKPENVMVDDKGRVKVLDFGLARTVAEGSWARSSAPSREPEDTAAAPASPAGDTVAWWRGRGALETQQGAILGTMGYMSPEQARGEAATAASDMYAVGLILQEVFTGQRPFEEGLDPMAMLVSAAEARTAPVTGLAPDLTRLIERLKSPAPGGRPSALDAVAMLREIEDRPRRRRRRLAIGAVGALLVIGTSVPLGLWLAARSRASRQTAVAERFARQARDVEWSLRVAHLLPLHDTAPERATVRARMAEIERDMAALGPLADGPGHAALGRAALVLADYRTAWDHLERAWGAGHRTADTAAARALALAGLYQVELDGLDGIASRTVREARREQLAREYRPRVLAELQAGRGASFASSELVEALIAFYEERYDDVPGILAPLIAASSGDYEARLLDGRAHKALGEGWRTSGQTARAMASYRQAEVSLQAAIAIARSLPDAYLRLCDLYQLEMVTSTDAAGGDEATFRQQAVEACESGIAADSESSFGFARLAEVHRRSVEDAVRRGEPPGEAAELAERAVRRALELDDGSYNAHNTLGLLLENLAGFDAGRGGDPVARYREAIHHLTRATEIAPANPQAWNNLGYVYLGWAELDRGHGRDPRPALDGASRGLTEALRLVPDYAYGHNNLGNVYTMRADHEARRGIDPRPSLELAAKAFARAIEIKPDHITAYNNLGYAFVAEAMWLVRHGGDPESQLQSAAESFDAALRIKPTYATPRFNQGLMYRTAALAATARGESPAAPIRAAVAAFEAGLATSGGVAEVYAELADVHRIEVEHDVEQGRSPAVALAALAAAARRALELNPRSSGAQRALGLGELSSVGREPTRQRAAESRLASSRQHLLAALELDGESFETLQALAELELALGRRRHSRGGDIASAIAAGLGWVERGLAVAPEEPTLLAAASELQALAAETSPDAATARAAALEVRRLVARAVAGNPRLAARLKAPLAAAARLAEPAEAGVAGG